MLGGGAEGKGPKQKEKGDKGKGKEVAAKAEEKKEEDTDGVWMVTADSDEGIRKWIDECGGDKGNEYEMWTEDESPRNLISGLKMYVKLIQFTHPIPRLPMWMISSLILMVLMTPP